MREKNPDASANYFYAKLADGTVRGNNISTGIWGQWCIMSSCKHPENVEFTLSTDDNGILKVDDIKTSGGEETKNPPVTTIAKTVEPVITETVCNADEQIYESVQLGENIWGFVYPDDSMYIYGSGDMYSDRNLSIKNVKTIKEVIFNDNDPENGEYITSIGKHLFDGAENLEVVYLSNEIKSIGEFAFCGCKKLRAFRYGGEDDTSETLVFPSKIKYIGVKAFLFCDDVPFGDLTFGDKLETIDMQAFQGDNGITSLYIPENVTSIGSSAFENCKGLKKAIIKASAKDYRGMFYGAESLEELVLPSFITIRESGKLDQLFNDNYENLVHSSTKVPETLNKIVVLSGDKVPEGAFNGFSNVEVIAVPEGIKTIGKNAFNSGGITSIVCSDESKKLSFSELFKDVEDIGEKAFFGSNVKIGDLVFGNKLRTIGMQAFQGASGITGVNIPESVTWLGASAFENCSLIKKAVIKSKAEDFRGCFYGASSLEELVLPGFVTVRGDHSLAEFFNDNDEVPYNDTKVPESLKKISVLSGDKIPDRALRDFVSVEVIGLPEGLTSIGAEAIPGYSLQKIICSDETKELSVSELLKDVTSIGTGAFSGCSKLEIGELRFGDELISIGESAFSECKGITELYIPKNTESIGFKAFNSCEAINRVVIDSKKAKLTGAMLYGCSGITEMKFLTFNTINSNRGNQLRLLFNNHSDSWELEYIPKELTRITFFNGEAMSENYLNNFYNVTVLELPHELKLVGKHATQDMGALEEVIYNGTEEEWAEIDIKEENDPLIKKTKIYSPKEAEEWLSGDANGDGEIDMSDVVLIMQALSNPNKYGVEGTDSKHITESGFKYADSDDDGLTVNDALRIQQYLLGLIPSLT